LNAWLLQRLGEFLIADGEKIFRDMPADVLQTLLDREVQCLGSTQLSSPINHHTLDLTTLE